MEVFIALTGQTDSFVFPIRMIWPDGNGSVLVPLMRTDGCSGFPQGGRKLTSPRDKWMSEENALLQVNPLRRGKTKNAKVVAAQVMTEL